MQVKFFVIVVEIDLEDCGTLISDETAHSITTIEDTKTGPLSLTVTTDRVHTVSVTTIGIQKQNHCLLLLLLIEFTL
jgi:hypothetical protein